MRCPGDLKDRWRIITREKGFVEHYAQVFASDGKPLTEPEWSREDSSTGSATDYSASAGEAASGAGQSARASSLPLGQEQGGASVTSHAHGSPHDDDGSASTATGIRLASAVVAKRLANGIKAMVRAGPPSRSSSQTNDSDHDSCVGRAPRNAGLGEQQQSAPSTAEGSHASGSAGSARESRNVLRYTSQLGKRTRGLTQSHLEIDDSDDHPIDSGEGTAPRSRV